MDRFNPDERAIAIRHAAVAFANDYGPLALANTGNQGGAHEVAIRLVQKLRDQGLMIVQSTAE